MKISPLKQRDESDCGPTSIYMTVRYFGLPQTFEGNRGEFAICKKDGLSNVDLVETLKKLGFVVRTKSKCHVE